MIFLLIIMCVILWFSLGFLAFLLEAKMESFIRFDSEARTELRYCLFLGAISLLVMFYISCIKPLFEKGNERFDDFMNDVLLNINHEDKGGR